MSLWSSSQAVAVVREMANLKTRKKLCEKMFGGIYVIFFEKYMQSKMKVSVSFFWHTLVRFANYVIITHARLCLWIQIKHATFAGLASLQF